MTAIFKRELKSYFDTMTGYVFIAFLTAFTGVYFMAVNLKGGYAGFSSTVGSLIMFLLIGIPVLTMKSFAEDRRSRTDILLLTAPVRLWKIVLAKYLAMVAVFFIPVLITCLCPLIIKANGTAYLLEDYSAILAYFLLGCVFIAVGMFVSSLTESLIIAAAGTFGILLVMYLWYGLISFLPTSAKGAAAGFLVVLTLLCLFLFFMTRNWFLSVLVEAAGAAGVFAVYFAKPSLLDNALPNILSKLAVTEVFDSIAAYHIFDIGGLVFYGSLIFIFLFLTVQSVQKRRWS